MSFYFSFVFVFFLFFFFFKQKTAYEIYQCDWSSDVCSSDLVMAPAVILGTIWTFNNFNIPFFINENELETSDILVTALFRAAFQYNRYGFAAAFAFVIFLVLFIFAVLYMRATGGLKGVYEK